MVDLAALQPGYRFLSVPLVLDRDTVAAYVAAVEDPSPLHRGDRAVVPPLAVLALAMRGLTALLAERPGAVHLSQKVAAHGPIPVGSSVTAQITVTGRSERRGFAALNLEVRVESGTATVLDGSMLLFVPLRAEGDTHA